MIWNSVKNKPIHLIVSSDGVRNQLIQLLGKLPHKIKTFENANDFINEPISEAPACLITEIKLNDSDGITLIKQMREHGLSTPVVVIADGSHSVNTAVEAIQAGATDFIEQPIVERDFLELMQNILDTK
ncbi:MAG: response regulator [Gammaproteobacteria bacterium]|nr:response regulator [Gammaproteobacteria bacterium]